MRKFLKLLCLTFVLTSMFTLVACGSNGNSGTKESNSSTSSSSSKASAKPNPTKTPTATSGPTMTPVPVTGELSKGSCTVLFTMSDGQTFTVKCEPQYAPETVENFLSLVKSGFYNGLTFHRILDNFVAQGGDPKGTGQGGSDKKIHGEFSSNGFTQNTLTHKRGSIAMARSSEPNSASSQFYVCYQDLPSLDGQYAVFGQVTQGMEVIDGFLKVQRDSSGKPSTPITIKSAEIIK